MIDWHCKSKYRVSQEMFHVKELRIGYSTRRQTTLRIFYGTPDNVSHCLSSKLLHFSLYWVNIEPASFLSRPNISENHDGSAKATHFGASPPGFGELRKVTDGVKLLEVAEKLTHLGFGSSRFRIRPRPRFRKLGKAFGYGSEEARFLV